MFQEISKYQNVEEAAVNVRNLYNEIKNLKATIKENKNKIKELRNSRYALKPRFKDLKNEKLINLDKSFNIKLLRAKVRKTDVNEAYDDYDKERKSVIDGYDEKYDKRFKSLSVEIIKLIQNIYNNEQNKKLKKQKYKLSIKYLKWQRNIVSNLKCESRKQSFEHQYIYENKCIDLKHQAYIGMKTDEQVEIELLALESLFLSQKKSDLEASLIIYEKFALEKKSSIKEKNIHDVNIKIIETKELYKKDNAIFTATYQKKILEQEQIFNDQMAQEGITKEQEQIIKLENKLAVQQIKFLRYSDSKVWKDKLKELKNEKLLYEDSVITHKQQIVIRFYNEVDLFQTRFKSLNAIKLTFLTVFPIILLGAFVTLFTNVVFSIGSGSLVDIFNITLTHEAILWLSRIRSLFEVIGAGTSGTMALYILVVMSYNISKNYNQNVVWVSTISSIIAFFLLSNDFLGSSALFSSTFGTDGMLTAIILPIVIVKLFSLLERNEFLKLKLPASIPDAVAKSLNALVPMFILLTSVSFFSILLVYTTPLIDPLLDLTNHDMIQAGPKTLAQMLSLVISLPMNLFFEINIFMGVLMFVAIWSLIWWFGINSSAILGAFLWSKFGAWSEVTRFSESFFGSNFINHMVNIGGAGGTFALILVIFAFSKRNNWKMISKIALIPALFGINEPILFGLPLVFNPMLFLPFILAPLAAVFMYVFLDGFNIMNLYLDKKIDVPWTMPPIFGAYWATGSWRGAMFAIMVILVQGAIYTPFVMLDNNIFKLSVSNELEDNSFSFRKNSLKIINELEQGGSSETLEEYIDPHEDYYE